VVPIAGPLIFLFLAPYNRDTGVRFHAWQALFLQLAWLAAHTIGNVFTGISWRLTALVHEIVGLVYLIAVLLLAIRTYQGEKLVLPVIGPLAERQK
jgi:uncharacterized membrane protein